MRVSIALCTYNGVRYVGRQLESIADQQRLPDEIVVCDDRSTDGTMEIVADFAEHASFPVLLSVNEETLGVTKNFEQAIAKCSGDVIFLCDQDDYWLPGKIAEIAREFEADETIGLVFSDAAVAGPELDLLGYTMWDTIGFNNEAVRRFNGGEALAQLIRNYIVTGATAAFRRSLLQEIVPIPSVFLHDAWIAPVAAACSKVLAIDRPLIKYRQHGANVVGGRRKGLFEKMKVSRSVSRLDLDLEIARSRELLRKLKSLPRCAVGIDNIQRLESKIGHVVVRRRMFDNGLLSRVVLVFQEACALRYCEFSSGSLSIATDLCFRGPRSR